MGDEKWLSHNIVAALDANMGGIRKEYMSILLLNGLLTCTSVIHESCGLNMGRTSEIEVVKILGITR